MMLLINRYFPQTRHLTTIWNAWTALLKWMAQTCGLREVQSSVCERIFMLFSLCGNLECHGIFKIIQSKSFRFCKLLNLLENKKNTFKSYSLTISFILYWLLKLRKLRNVGCARNPDKLNVINFLLWLQLRFQFWPELNCCSDDSVPV